MCAFQFGKPRLMFHILDGQAGLRRRSRLFRWRLGVTALLAATAAACALPQKEPDPVASRPCKINERIQQCATVPLALQNEEVTAKAFQPPAAGMARIYITRPYKQEWRKTSEVFINDRLVGRLAPETFLAIEVPQGLHTVTVKTDVVSTFQIPVEAGQLHYLRYQLDFWVSRITGKLKPIDAEAAQHQILKARMVAVLPGN